MEVSVWKIIVLLGNFSVGLKYSQIKNGEGDNLLVC